MRYAAAVTGVLPTNTYPSHTTMVTGVSPSRHGILNNSPFDPFGKNQGGWMWYAEDIKALTLWEAVGRAGGVTSSVGLAGYRGRTHHLQHRANLARDDGRRSQAAQGALNAGPADGSRTNVGRIIRRGTIYTVESDTTRAAFNAWMIEQKKPRFHTAYFSVLDEVQHERGPYHARSVRHDRSP